MYNLSAFKCYNLGCNNIIMSTQTSRLQVAKNLKRVRSEKHLTQRDIAEKAGISVNYYARIERADVKPSVETLEKIIKALNVKSSDILPF